MNIKTISIAINIIFITLNLNSQSVSLEVPYFEQGNETPWAEEILGNKSNLTIETNGCALTCISMVTSHFSKESLTPSDMNQWLQINNGYQDDWEGNTYFGEVNLNWPSLAKFRQGYLYNISDTWGSGPSRNIYGIRILYPVL